MRNYSQFYIDGSWVDASDRPRIEVINPATEEVAGWISRGTAADVDDAVAAARAAFQTFSRTTREDRLDLLRSVLGTYVKRRQDLTDALVEELGAPAEFAFDVQTGIGALHIMTAIENLKTYAFERPKGPRTVVRYEPIGVIGMITPWNWPVNQIMCKIVPALATGNTMVHKPSEVTPFTAHIITEILEEAGVPKGVYNLIHGSGLEVGAAISSHPDVAMVSFTGSTGAGIDVAKRAADSVKRVHQELGGKSPNVVLPSADLGKAVTETIYRLMVNSGQTCHAPTRLLVPADRLTETKAIAAEVAAAITVGHPRSGAYMGPLVSDVQRQRVLALIQKGIDEGATLLAGGVAAPAGLDKGFYVQPTVFADTTRDMTIVKEEIFGPVLVIQSYETVDDAVSIANDTIYGLAAYVQAGTDDEAAAVAARIDAGMVYLNGAGEDGEAPFGGYKMSGNGREWGEIAFGDFLEIKAVIHKQAA
ncbi:aldehyde dehydrogenase family protein [Mycobacterium aquaticum]|uniref:Aldehyde dehydrogenase family protein n=1 Tax=Mycobacterium aquaticum TaxID=1927124 RepID=A0A1X0B765_9MYCO|nr:aldehyde dehydrogenase family protein [Mycobacterium aquaticum]ORA38162.1 aldehyde dehydrogenase family protein [Mycobacterium aquaticum]